MWALVWNSSVTSGHWLFPLAETELNFHITWEAPKEWDFPCTHFCGLHHHTGKWQPCPWQWTGAWWDLRFLLTQTILWFTTSPSTFTLRSRVGLDAPSWSLPTMYILWFYDSSSDSTPVIQLALIFSSPLLFSVPLFRSNLIQYACSLHNYKILGELKFFPRKSKPHHPDIQIVIWFVHFHGKKQKVPSGWKDTLISLFSIIPFQNMEHWGYF